MELPLSPDQRLSAAYFGYDAKYYLIRQFKLDNGYKAIINVYPFLFGEFWFAYRKMYLWFFITTLAVEGGLLFWGTKHEMAITLFIRITLSVVANSIYIRRANKELLKAKDNYMRCDEQMQYLKRKGGISFLAPTLGLILVTLMRVWFLESIYK